jgi:hypothetical protein
MGLGISSSGVAYEFFGFAEDDPVALKIKRIKLTCLTI